MNQAWVSKILRSFAILPLLLAVEGARARPAAASETLQKPAEYGSYLNTPDCLTDTLTKMIDGILTLPRESTIQAKRQRIGISMREMVEKDGKNFDEMFSVMKIPEEARPYFDPTTGRFNYKTDSPNILALENGDSELRAIRMNWPLHHEEVARQQLRDLTQFLRKSPSTELWIVADTQGELNAKNALNFLPKDLAHRIHLIPYRDEAPLMLWAQDGSKPLETANMTLLPREDNHRGSYFQAVHALKEAGKTQARRSLFHFEGGNTVVGARHVFVGPSTIADAMTKFRISEREAIKALSEEFRKPVFVVGAPRFVQKRDQIDFHIDLTMAVVRDKKSGDEVILLESNRLAFELLLGNKTAASLPQTHTHFFESLIRGQLGPEAAKTRHLMTSGEKDLKALLRVANPEHFLRREERLDFAARELQEAGYRVIRIPGISQMEHGESATTRIFNYTNGIFSGQHALMPQMGVRIWDEAVKKQLEVLGYDVVPMPVTQKSLCLQGGIRCMSETYRKPPRPKPH